MIRFLLFHDVASGIEVCIQAKTTMRADELLARTIAKLATTGTTFGSIASRDFSKPDALVRALELYRLLYVGMKPMYLPEGNE